MKFSTHGDEQEDTMNILWMRACNRTLGGKSGSGFTLIELLLVVAIIGILGAIAVPIYLGQRTKAAQVEATGNLQALRLVLEQRFAESGCYHVAGGPPPVCTNATISGVANIQAAFPNFRPGQDTNLRFTYELKTCGNPNASAFTAYATGKAGTPVHDTRFWIDQNNSMNAAAPPCP